MLSNLENNIFYLGTARIISFIAQILIAIGSLVISIIWGSIVAIIFAGLFLAINLGSFAYYLFGSKAVENIDPVATGIIIGAVEMFVFAALLMTSKPVEGLSAIVFISCSAPLWTGIGNLIGSALTYVFVDHDDYCRSNGEYY